MTNKETSRYQGPNQAEEKKISQIKNYLFYLMIFVVIVLCMYVIYKIKTESIKCMASPLTYGVSKLRSSNGEDITCSCYFPGSRQTLFITKNKTFVSSTENLIK